jgi:hypothetical protein
LVLTHCQSWLTLSQAGLIWPITNSSWLTQPQL